jgi:KDO2-lipid IV(A) lauroyltransferase
MTLSTRLAVQTGATILLAWGERLPWGRGFRLHFRPWSQAAVAQDAGAAAAQVNAAMEGLIRECPQQYLWGYARYKKPRAGPGADGAA